LENYKTVKLKNFLYINNIMSIHTDNNIDNYKEIDSDDSSVISEIGDKKINAQEYDNIEKEANEEYIKTVVCGRIIDYIKLDDVIKQKQKEFVKEMKHIKDTKNKLEKYLIGYLDKVNEEEFGVGESMRLVKSEKKTVSPPKMEDITKCLVDGFKSKEIFDDDEKIVNTVKDYMLMIESKRKVNVKKYIKRVQKKT